MYKVQGVSDEIQIAIRAAIEAGDEILEVYYNADFEVEYKKDNSPLTIADKKAHEVIVRWLTPTSIPVLSEEGKSIAYETRKNWDLFWLVDPLDGTKEFVKKNDEFTVNIALIKNGSPIGGVVFVPVTKELYYSDEKGAYKAIVGKEITEIQRLPLRTETDKYIVVGSRSHRSAETDAFIQGLDTQGKEIEIKSKGSSLKICLVAEGNATIYPRLGPTMEWDTAAGHAIAKYAGKKLYQFPKKEKMVYNKENLLNPWFVVE